MRYLLLLLLLVALASCATATQRTIDEQILTADRTITLIEASADAALRNGVITVNQAEAVSAIAHQVNPLLDSARAASRAANPAEANKTLVLVQQILSGLQSYVPPPASK